MSQNEDKAVLAEIKLLSDLYVSLNSEGREFLMMAALESQQPAFLQAKSDVLVSQDATTVRPRVIPAVKGIADDADRPAIAWIIEKPSFSRREHFGSKYVTMNFDAIMQQSA